MKLLLEVLRTAYQWYMIHKTPFELTGLLLAVAGTAFAVLSIKDGHRLTKETRPQFLQEMDARQQRALDADLRFADRWEYRGVHRVGAADPREGHIGQRLSRAARARIVAERSLPGAAQRASVSR
jgi:hypothetical protein